MAAFGQPVFRLVSVAALSHYVSNSLFLINQEALVNVCDERIPSWRQNMFNRKRRNELQFSTMSPLASYKVVRFGIWLSVGSVCNQFEKQNGLWTSGDIQLWKFTNLNKTDYIHGLMQKWGVADTWDLRHFKWSYGKTVKLLMAYEAPSDLLGTLAAIIG